MTVPPSFRRRVIPRALVFHREDLKEDEITILNGIPVTTVYRTLLDMIREQTVSPEQLVMAMDTALERGIFTQKILANLRSEFHPDYQPIDWLLENLARDPQNIQQA